MTSHSVANLSVMVPPLTTTFFVPSIHCSSCGSFIEALIHRIDPKTLVETSVDSHSTTVHHYHDANIVKMMRALGESGYEVNTIAAEPQTQAANSINTITTTAEDNSVISGWINQIKSSWNLFEHFRDRKSVV